MVANVKNTGKAGKAVNGLVRRGRNSAVAPTTATVEDLVNGSIGSNVELRPAIGGDMPGMIGNAGSSSPLDIMNLNRIGSGAVDDAVGMASAGVKAAGTAAKGVAKKAAAVVGEAAEPFQVLEGVENIANVASTVGNFSPLAVPAALGLAGLGAKVFGSGAVEKVTNLKNYINPELSKEARSAGHLTKLDKVNNVAWVAGNALSIYGVAKGFTQELNSLRHMYADLTGVPADKVSTIKLLTGHIPKMLEESRSHLLKEYGVRTAIQTLGLAWILKDLKKGVISLQAGLVPMFAGQAADAIMGSSLMPVYAQFKNAYNQKEIIPAEAYADFVLVASHDLKSRGTVGKMVAAKVAEQFATEKTDPGAILREINDGSFKIRIQDLIAAAETEHAAKIVENKAKAAEAKLHHDTPQNHADTGNMVSKINGEKHQQPVVGKFTQQLSKETPATLAIT